MQELKRESAELMKKSIGHEAPCQPKMQEEKAAASCKCALL
jgi:hypothetical protein